MPNTIPSHTIYDIIVVGAGHAGCEAALAAARSGLRVLLLTLSMDAIALLACNPSIGGTAKGHLVREVDALGGQMALTIDDTYLQLRMLNASKGPAVQSLRAQADKHAYALAMRRALESTPSLTLRQSEAATLHLDGQGRIASLTTATGLVLHAPAIILACGVYLRSRTIIGDHIQSSGPSGLSNAPLLSAALESLGFTLRRFKTGTPARVSVASIDFSRLVPQPGESIPPFSFLSPRTLTRPQYPCYLTYTTPVTHEIIRRNLHLSPLYQGIIEGTGARYCPSIEDKIVRFADKDRHPVFLEPESLSTSEYYVQGVSTSLPESVQWELYRSIPGLESADLVRLAYAIEYDCIDPTALLPTLMARHIPGLFVAGQLNGSSGYEEAAAQGMIAGINASAYLRGLPPLIIGRDEGYIGVLIDDLVTKGTNEPYRMMTSRAEYRLSLRQDNADLRLTERAVPYGTISPERLDRVRRKRAESESEFDRWKRTNIPASPERAALLESLGEPPIESGITLAELLKRPNLTYAALAHLDAAAPEVDIESREQAELNTRYEGYLQMQARQIRAFREKEDAAIPTDLDYAAITGLRIEARQKLTAIRPASIGQAGRISGVSPGDIAVLLIGLEKRRREERNEEHPKS